METLALYAGLFALVGGVIWALVWTSGKRGEERIGGQIIAGQQREAAKKRRSLRERARLRGEPLRKRLREMAGRG